MVGFGRVRSGWFWFVGFVTPNAADETGVPAVVGVSDVAADERLVIVKSNAWLAPPTVLLASVTCAGRGLLLSVQVMSSPACGVSVKLVPAPAGSNVDVAVAFVQAIELAYCANALADPGAIASLRV